MFKSGCILSVSLILLFTFGASNSKCEVFGFRSDNNVLTVYTPRFVEPNWPLFFTVKSNHENLFIKWDFFAIKTRNGRKVLDLQSDKCLKWNGYLGSPCVGSTIAKSFAQEGKYMVQLTYFSRGITPFPKQMKFTVQVRNEKAKKVAVRKEFRELSDKEWESFVDALFLLKHFDIYDLLVIVHTRSMQMRYNNSYPDNNISHGSPAFCPWHRLFIRIFEKALGTFSGKNNLAIPVWDWTKDAKLSDPKSSPIWSDKYLGGDGDFFRSGEVKSGKFCGRKSKTCDGRWILKFDGPYLRRQLGYNYPILPSHRNVEKILAQTIYDSPPFNNESIGFRPVLEGWAGPGHNSVHMFVGGSMSMASSPNDPVFLLHHTYVDFIYHKWQRKNKCARSCYRPSDNDDSLRNDKEVPAAVKIDGRWKYIGQQWSEILWPWDLRIKDVLDTGDTVQLGYSYQLEDDS